MIRSLAPSRLAGFTLIELIIVIVVMGILSFGTVQFIVHSSEGYANAARWERLGSAGRVAVEKMAREIRNALPNSTRVGNSVNLGIPCIEFVPVIGASNYTSIPTLTASIGFESIPFANAPLTNRVAVYPLSSSDIYTLPNWPASAGTPSVVSPLVATVSTALVSLTDPVPVAWEEPFGTPVSHAFPSESPSRRWFMVADPVSFCLVGGEDKQLFRYSGYGFQPGDDSQPFPEGATRLLPTAAPDRRLIADGITLEGTPFELEPATLQRNALVQFDLSFKSQGEGIRISHEVQLRNVP